MKIHDTYIEFDGDENIKPNDAGYHVGGSCELETRTVQLPWYKFHLSNTLVVSMVVKKQMDIVFDLFDTIVWIKDGKVVRTMSKEYFYSGYEVSSPVGQMWHVIDEEEAHEDEQSKGRDTSTELRASA